MRVYSYTSLQPEQKPGKAKKRFKKPDLKKILTWAFRVCALGVVAVALLFLYYSKDLPDPGKLLNRQVPESTKIFARDGSLLYEIHGEYKRTLVNLDQISPYVKDATIALEDKDFYKHGGISFTGIARSVVVDVLSGKKAQGGSTITQQLVKNAILTNDKSWDRKIKELILAVAIDAKYSKEQILQMYLNEIPYGRNAYGIEAAAQTYFGKPAKDLDIAESAYLASVVQAPTRYNPLGPNRQLLDDRKNTALSLMQQQGYINQNELKQAKEETVNFKNATNGIVAPHFVMYVENYLAQKYGETSLEEGGLKVTTTLDPHLQEIAEKSVKENIEKESSKYNAHNGALVAIDPKTGQILAMVGSKDYFGDPEPAGCKPGKNCLYEPNVNVATAQRQPGSSFKPYVYVTAFKSDYKYSPASMLVDVTTNFGSFNGKDYIPGNYNGQNYGPVSMRQALAGSLNIPAVKTLALVGVNNAVQTAHDLGITSPLEDCGLSLVLGGCEVRLVDHVTAYSVLANEGVKNDQTSILKVEDKNGQVLEEYKSNPKNVLDPQVAYELISIMTDNNARSFIFGPNSPLTLPDRPVAAKTGTTQNWHDGWTLGFTPSLAAGVWVGNNDGTLLKKAADGVVVAAPIWHQFMQQALAGTPAENFNVPSGIQQISVDSVTGLLPTDLTPSTKTETFADFSVPTQSDNMHVRVAIDSLTGEPATTETPPQNIILKNYLVLHSEKPTDPNWENPVVAWAQSNGYSYPPGGAVISTGNQNNQNSNNTFSVNFVQPSDGAVIAELPQNISVSAISPNAIIKVDLYIDGNLVASQQTAPYNFLLTTKYSDGVHTFAIKAFDSLGNEADTSAKVTFAINNPITLTQPDGQSPIIFPLTMSASSANLYNQANFYYVTPSGQTRLIGPSGQPSRVGDLYQYTLNWNANLPAGNYKVFVQTETGASSQKIKITVP